MAGFWSAASVILHLRLGLNLSQADTVFVYKLMASHPHGIQPGMDSLMRILLHLFRRHVTHHR